MYKVRLCYFSGAAIDLKPKDRTAENVLDALKRDPKVSTWDMSESAWLRSIIGDLERQGLIREKQAAYPWHLYDFPEVE